MLLVEEHDRAVFTCGVESLDRYLKTQAGQDVRRKANAVFILSEVSEPTRVLGYHTLCAMAISPGDVPEAALRHIPRYPLVSATLIGRLATAKELQGQRLGGVLLADALRRAFDSASTVGSAMVVVDALDEAAAGFYTAMGSCGCPTRFGWFYQYARRQGALSGDGHEAQARRHDGPGRIGGTQCHASLRVGHTDDRACRSRRSARNDGIARAKCRRAYPAA